MGQVSEKGLAFDDFDTTACSFDLAFGASGNTMSMYFERDTDIATPKDDNRVAFVAQQANTTQRLRGYFGIGFESSGQLIEVHFIKYHLERRREALTTHKGQAAIERQVATLTIQVTALTRASARSLGTTSGCF